MAFKIICRCCGKTEYMCGEELPDMDGYCYVCANMLMDRERLEQELEDRLWFDSFAIIVWLCAFGAIIAGL